MLIFLDSNILCSNYFLNGPSFEVMRKVGTIVICEIVYDEVCNKYHEMLIENNKKMQRAIEDLNRLLPSPLTLSSESIINDAVEKYEGFLYAQLLSDGFIEAYPDISHKMVVNRALSRKKPFKEDGSTGYRDYLIWRSLINVAKSYSQEEIHFISTNIRDFADITNKEALHPDLLKELQDDGIAETRIHYWNSLKAFIDRYALSIAKQIDDRDTLIKNIESNRSGFVEPLEEFIRTRVIGTNIYNQELLVPGDSPELIATDETYDISIEDIVDIDDAFLIDVVLSCDGIIESQSKSDKISEYKELGYDFEITKQENGLCTLQTIQYMHLHVKVFYDKASKEIASIELQYIDDDNCDYCP